jgi:acetoin utilization protein AcuB
MFVGMWMSKNVLTVGPGATIGEAATLMRQHRIRRVPVVDPAMKDSPLVGIVTNTDIMHAFPPDLNPLSNVAGETLAKRELASRAEPVTVSQIMTRDPATTVPGAPIEAAARTMRDRKIGALPVVSEQGLVGLITESDIFRAFVAMFDTEDRGARFTFSITPDEDVFPLLSEIAEHRGLRIVNVISVFGHDQPVCVVQVSGHATEGMLDDIWRARRRVIHVVQLPLR